MGGWDRLGASDPLPIHRPQSCSVIAPGRSAPALFSAWSLWRSLLLYPKEEGIFEEWRIWPHKLLLRRSPPTASPTGLVLPALVPSQSPLPQPSWGSVVPPSWIPPLLAAPLARGPWVHTALPLAWALSGRCRLIQSRHVIVSVPWSVHRNRHVDAFSLVRVGQSASLWSTEGGHGGNVPGIWRQLETVHADCCGSQASNWVVKIAFSLLYTISAILWVIGRGLKTRSKVSEEPWQASHTKDVTWGDLTN